MTEKEALNQAMKLCSKKEYSSGEMKKKFLEWELTEEVAQKVLSSLRDENFIDDIRFAQAFVNDKLKFSKWGKIKISYMLRQKGVSDLIVSEALKKIDQEGYEKILINELQKKIRSIKAANNYELKGNLIQFAASRGFEYEVASKIVNKII